MTFLGWSTVPHIKVMKHLAGVDALFCKHADSVKVGLLGLHPALPQSRISTQLYNFQNKTLLALSYHCNVIWVECTVALCPLIFSGI